MLLRHFKAPALDGENIELKRKEIYEYFVNCYKRYESLFELLNSPKAFYEKPEPLRHPLIFYYGHSAAFFINKLKLAKIIDAGIDPKLESIFAVGVDEMSWDDLDANHYNWPTLDKAKEYRQKVFDLVSNIILTMPMTLPIRWESPWWAIMMGIEHENIHLETSSVLIRQHDINYINASMIPRPKLENLYYPINDFVAIASGEVRLGVLQDNYNYYGWDNEYGEHKALIPEFAVSKFLVSNGEFLEFINDGGYQKDEYWDQEGLAWRSFKNAAHPTFWKKTDSGYMLRTLAHEIPLQLDLPVEVNFLEAFAFCRWKSEKSGKNITLPTEDEYCRMLSVATDINIANIDLKYDLYSSPVNKFNHGKVFDAVGNVWQWTRTPIYPFEKFKVHPLYDDFTLPTYDTRHNLIKGGSWVSCGNLANTNSRYAFRRHFFQHAGFRYVISNYEENIEPGMYLNDEIVSQYCHFGWGKEKYFDVENFPKTCIDKISLYIKSAKRKRALDIGCAIGRSSFELAKYYDEVVGVDFSARFIQYAADLKENRTLRYVIRSEGEIEDFYEIRLEDFGLEKYAKNVSFWQGDACNLKPIYQNFDLVFAGNLLDRLYDPVRFLTSMASRINHGGFLVIVSPYTWLEEFTPKDKWIGGFKKDGENFTTLDGLKEYLKNDFRLVDTCDVPFVIRETSRKYQHSISQMTIWERR